MRNLLLCMLLVLFLGACAPKIIETPATLIPVNVCYSALAGTQAVPWYAYENGLFTKYGLQVNLVSMSGGTAAVTSLISGDMDICEVAAPSVINAVVAHQDVVIIAGLINTVPGSLMTQPEITSTSMLRGKVFGIDQGGSAEAITRLMLKTLNLDPDKDIVMLSVGGQPERAAALEAHQIDATFIIPPMTVEMRKKGFVELVNAGEAKIPYQGTSIATSRHFMTDKRSVVTAFMKATLEAIALIKNDPEGTKSVVAKYMSLDMVADSVTLQETYTAILLDALEKTPYPTLDGLQAVIDIAAKDNPAAASLKPADVIDTSILANLEKSGFISSLKTK
jgi:NitT/TauT family transport system substrate-binding protein